MPALRRMCKPAIWACIAILLLVTMYVGAYYRSVRPVNVPKAWADERGQVRVAIQLIPHYALPWPIPAQVQQSGQQKLKSWFAPVHRLDRHLRREVWAGRTVGRPVAPLDESGI